MMLMIILLVLILATALPHLEVPNGKWFWRRIISILLVCTLILTYESISSSQYYLFNGQLSFNFKLTCLHILVIFTGLSLIVINNNRNWTLSNDIFMISAIAGSLLLSSAYTSLTLLLGLELQSFSVYVLAASHKNFEPAESAGLKYFLLGAQSSALVFMGLALLYCANGNLNLEVKEYCVQMDINYQFVHCVQLQYFGILLIFIGLIWKIAAFPLHAWSVDVYDALPNNTAAFLSLIPKIALISTILRITANIFNMGIGSFFSQVRQSLEGKGTDINFHGNNWAEMAGVNNAYFMISFTIIVIASLSAGAILGLYQPRIKRLLAYSSILNMGFILMSILLTNSLSLSNNYSVFTYVAQYILVTAATWLCIIAIPICRSADKNLELTIQSQLQGISNLNNKESDSNYPNSNYVMAITLTVLILSVAGIPPMVGFFAKYDVILLAVQSERLDLAFFAIGASLISTVYYLRLVRNIWFVSNNSNLPVASLTTLNNLRSGDLAKFMLHRDSVNLSQVERQKSHITNWSISNNYSSIISLITLIVLFYVLMYSTLNTFISVNF